MKLFLGLELSSKEVWLVGAFNQDKALVGAFSVIVKSMGPFG